MLASDPHRRAGLAACVLEAGWDPIACESVGEADRQAKRWRTQLTVIDLAGLDVLRLATFRQFAQQQSASDRLLCVCDHEDGGESELWAREAGAWLYLPTSAREGELAGVFADGLGIAQKLFGTPKLSGAPKPPGNEPTRRPVPG